MSTHPTDEYEVRMWRWLVRIAFALGIGPMCWIFAGCASHTFIDPITVQTEDIPASPVPVPDPPAPVQLILAKQYAAEKSIKIKQQLEVNLQGIGKAASNYTGRGSCSNCPIQNKVMRWEYPTYDTNIIVFRIYSITNLQFPTPRYFASTSQKFFVLTNNGHTNARFFVLTASNKLSGQESDWATK